MLRRSSGRARGGSAKHRFSRAQREKKSESEETKKKMSRRRTIERASSSSRCHSRSLLRPSRVPRSASFPYPAAAPNRPDLQESELKSKQLSLFLKNTRAAKKTLDRFRLTPQPSRSPSSFVVVVFFFFKQLQKKKSHASPRPPPPRRRLRRLRARRQVRPRQHPPRGRRGPPLRRRRGAAELGAALVAIAGHGKGKIAKWLVGSVTEEVVARCSVPVLLVQ